MARLMERGRSSRRTKARERGYISGRDVPVVYCNQYIGQFPPKNGLDWLGHGCEPWGRPLQPSIVPRTRKDGRRKKRQSETKKFKNIHLPKSYGCGGGYIFQRSGNLSWTERKGYDNLFATGKIKTENLKETVPYQICVKSPSDHFKSRRESSTSSCCLEIALTIGDYGVF